jgi:hypothetical protein
VLFARNERVYADLAGKGRKEVKRMLLSKNETKFNKFKDDIYNRWVERDMIKFSDHFGHLIMLQMGLVVRIIVLSR